jgi:hypothetical protein
MMVIHRKNSRYSITMKVLGYLVFCNTWGVQKLISKIREINILKSSLNSYIKVHLFIYKS